MEFIGECCVCEELLDLEDAGFCEYCGEAFCWSNCGDWYNGVHCCENCKEEEDI